MLMGAIIGAVVAMVAVLIVIARNAGRLSKITTPLAAGDRTGARAAIDRQAPRNDQVTTPAAAARARERFAALAIIEDRAALVAEVPALGGSDKQAPYAKGFGFLALAALGEKPAEQAAAFEALVRTAEQGGHKKLALAALRSQLAMTRALAGEAVDAKSLSTFKTTHADKGIIEHFAKQCLARATSRPAAAAA